jgi:hypothetical protein
MGKEILIIALGFWVAALPFLGFPAALDTIFYAVSGVCIALLGILVRRDVVLRESRTSRTAETFTQNASPDQLPKTDDEKEQHNPETPYGAK